jgi:hypothetical protein
LIIHARSLTYGISSWEPAENLRGSQGLLGRFWRKFGKEDDSYSSGDIVEADKDWIGWHMFSKYFSTTLTVHFMIAQEKALASQIQQRPREEDFYLVLDQ